MGIKCEIFIKQPFNSVLKPGDIIKGEIKYIVEKATNLVDIIISLKGKGFCEWKRGKYKENLLKYEGNENIIDARKTVFKKNSDVVVLVEAGTYTASFEFILPNKLPPTHKDRNSSINYYISVKFIKADLFKTAKKFKTFLIIGTKIEPTSNDKLIYELEKNISGIFTNKENIVKLRARISKLLVSPRENFEIILDVQNKGLIKINKITINLVEINTYTADCGSKKTKFRVVKECKSTVQEVLRNSNIHCGIVVPALDSINTIQHSIILRKDYKIVITVKLPMIHRNASIEIPVQIGHVL